VPVRIEDPKCVGKTFPDYFEALFSLVTAHREAVPVIAIDGPTASGKGTLAAAVSERAGLPPARFGLALPRWRRWRPCAPGAAARPTTRQP
jgi:hypothetical protein